MLLLDLVHSGKMPIHLAVGNMNKTQETCGRIVGEVSEMREMPGKGNSNGKTFIIQMMLMRDGNILYTAFHEKTPA